MSVPDIPVEPEEPVYPEVPETEYDPDSLEPFIPPDYPLPPVEAATDEELTKIFSFCNTVKYSKNYRLDVPYVKKEAVVTSSDVISGYLITGEFMREYKLHYVPEQNRRLFDFDLKVTNDNASLPNGHYKYVDDKGQITVTRDGNPLTDAESVEVLDIGEQIITLSYDKDKQPANIVFISTFQNLFRFTEDISGSVDNYPVEIVEENGKQLSFRRFSFVQLFYNGESLELKVWYSYDDDSSSFDISYMLFNGKNISIDSLNYEIKDILRYVCIPQG